MQMWFLKNNNNENKYFEALRKFVHSRMTKSRSEKQLGSRLDALLYEKAKEQNVKLPRKGIPTPFKIAGLATSFFATAIFVGIAVWVVRPDLYLPFIRFIARPEVAQVELQGVVFTPKGVSASTKEFTLNLPKEIDPKFAQALVKITPAVKYSVTVSSNQKQIIIKPETLAEGTNYTLELKSGLVFKDGSYLASPQSWVIPIEQPFAITGLSPADGSTAPYSAVIEVSINKDNFSLDDFKKLFSISPSVDGRFEKKPGKVVFIPNKQFQPGSSYKVTVAPGLKTDTNDVMKDGANSSFSISDQAKKDDGTYGYYQGPKLSFFNKIYNVSQNQDGALNTENISKFSVTFYQITSDKVQGIMEQIATKNAVNWEQFIKDGKKSQFLSVNAQDYQTFISYNSLASGIYILKAASADNQYTAYQLAFKSAHGAYVLPDTAASKVHVWTSDYAKLAPIGGIDISYISCSATQCSQPTTGDKTSDSGYGSINAKVQDGYVLTKRGDETTFTPVGAMFNNWIGFAEYTHALGGNGLTVQTQLSKPYYRPGETIRFNLLVRDRDGSNFIVPAEKSKYHVAVCTEAYSTNGFASKQQCIRDIPVTLDSNGQFAGEFPATTNRGALFLEFFDDRAIVDTFISQQDVSVLEFEKPRFVIEGKLSKDTYSLGDTIIFSGRVTDYAGSGIANRKINASFAIDPKVIENGAKTANIETVESANGDSKYFDLKTTTNDSGDFSISVVATKENLPSFINTVRAYAGFDDGDYSTYTSATTVVTTGTGYSIYATQKGLETTNGAMGLTATINIKGMSVYDFNALKNKKVNIVVTRRWSEKTEMPGVTVYNEITKQTEKKYEYVSKSEDVVNLKNVTLSDAGQYSVDIKQVKDGYYTATVEAIGEQWSAQKAVLYGTSESYNTTANVIDFVRFGANSAKVGETVPIQVQDDITAPGKQVLLAIMTNTLVKWEYVDLYNKQLEIPITQNMVGGVQVCLATSIRSAIESGGKLKDSGSGISSACASLAVEAPTQKLNVKVTADKQSYKPGDTFNANVEVTDSNGAPAQATVGITAVDQALQGMAENPEFWTEDLYASIYKQIRQDIIYPKESTSYYTLTIRGGDPGGRGAGDGGEQHTRTNFNDNPFWKTKVETDSNGKASISFTIPDSITSWILKSWAANTSTKVGTSYTKFTSLKDTYAIIDEPQFLRVGDKWNGGVTVVNTTANNFSGKLAVSCDGCLDTPYSAIINVPARSSRKYTVPFTIKTLSPKIRADVTFGSLTVDSVEIKPNVRSIDFSTIRGAILKLDGTKSFTFDAGKIVQDRSSVDINLSKFPVSVQDALLSDPVSSSSENISGAVLAGLYLLQNKDKVDVAINESEIKQSIRFQLQTLASRQKESGGFGWYDYDAADPVVTGHVAYVFGKAAAFSNEWADVITPAITSKLELYIQSTILESTTTTSDRIQLFYGGSEFMKDKITPYIIAFYTDAKRPTLTNDDKVFLAHALNVIASKTFAAQLVNELNDTRQKVGTDQAFGSFNKQLYATAVLAALNNDLKESVKDVKALGEYQNWLLASTSASRVSFGDYAALTETVDSFDVSYFGSFADAEVIIKSNGKQVGIAKYKQGEINSFSIKGSDLKEGNNAIEFTVNGSKILFASIQTNIITNSNVTEKAGDISIKREIQNVTKPGKAISVGDIGVVKLTLTSTKDLNAIVLREYLNAGITPVSYASDVFSGDLRKSLFAPNTYIATGDKQYSDAVSTYISTIKKGQNVTVLIPFMAIRSGTWGQSVTQINVSTTNGADVIKVNPTLTIQ